MEAQHSQKSSHVDICSSLFHSLNKIPHNCNTVPCSLGFIITILRAGNTTNWNPDQPGGRNVYIIIIIIINIIIIIIFLLLLLFCNVVSKNLKGLKQS